METWHNYLFCIVVIISILIIVIFSQSQNLTVDRLVYDIDDAGNAVVTANYTLNPIEKIWLFIPFTHTEITKVIKDEYGADAQVLFITDASTQFTIPKFADSYPKYLQSPSLTFENIKKRSNDLWFVRNLNIDYSPTVTVIAFPDGTEHPFDNVMMIPALTMMK